MFGKTKKYGEALISEVTGQFEELVAKLERGVQDCQDEQNGIKVQIEELKLRDTNLTGSVLRGQTMAQKLRDLTGLPTE
jgi:hypothetical protein